MSAAGQLGDIALRHEQLWQLIQAGAARSLPTWSLVGRALSNHRCPICLMSSGLPIISKLLWCGAIILLYCVRNLKTLNSRVAGQRIC